MMRTTLVVLIISIALLWAYDYVTLWTIHYAYALPEPDRWRSLFPTPVSAVITWMELTATGALLLVSVPFAFFLAHFFGRRGAWLGLGITTALTLLSLPGVLPFLAVESSRQRVTTAFHSLKLLVILPLLVLLISRLTSNNRWRGP